MDFEMIKLGEISDITKLAGFEFTKYIEYIDDGEIIALRALNLRKGELDLTDIKRIDRKVSESLTRSKLYTNDILLTYTGNGYGDCAMITEDDKYHLAPNICKITPDTEKVYPYYLYSYIRSNAFYQTMSSNMTGSSQPTIPMKTIRVLEVPLPDIEIQKRIGTIIQSIDEKIRNNTKINRNLLEQAFALFKEMFPNVNQGVHTLGEYLSAVKGKALLSKDAIEGNVPVIAGGLSPATYHNVANTKAPVLTISASGANAGYVALWHVDVWSSDSSYIDSNMTENVYFWYAMLKTRQKEIFDAQTGSAQPHIYPKNIDVLPVAELDGKVVVDYTMKVSPLFELMGKNIMENERLSVLRDTLLPKLMSGELDVSDLDI